MENGEWFIQAYNAENRLSSLTKLASGDCSTPGNNAGVWAFSYDGDGTRVAQLYTPYLDGQPQTDIITTYFLGGAYEVTGDPVSSVKKYYNIAGMTVAMSDGTTLYYLLSDHLGSVVAITDNTGTLTSQQRYLPFGQVRTDLNGPRITQTDLSFTGQRGIDGLGLQDYKARFYDALLGRFISPDTIIPDQSNPQSWNRYAYGNNSPIIYADPSGHDGELAILIGIIVIAIVGTIDVDRRSDMSDGPCHNSLTDCFKEKKLPEFRDHQQIDKNEFNGLLDTIHDDLKSKFRTSVDPSRAFYDTPFYDGNSRFGGTPHKDQIVCVDDKCSQQSAVNYIAEGMYSARTGQSLFWSDLTVQIWNWVWWGHAPTDDEIYWNEYGYKAYKEREKKGDSSVLDSKLKKSQLAKAE